MNMRALGETLREEKRRDDSKCNVLFLGIGITKGFRCLCDYQQCFAVTDNKSITPQRGDREVVGVPM